ncbi:cytochrome c oxidase assembly protein [Ramlibacter sp.]|uniref:cytochrome c oxidase assembly protein n=1 Tax=Ramlibacter sp. TaxID=1917967 RepID=UPI002D0B2B11|nr:cytochrome c oxidase assembly protein [Ramlibacter sp.]HWI84008.1 cytochrome c oxidase assembly protein [Ramlibacter sp.]
MGPLALLFLGVALAGAAGPASAHDTATAAWHWNGQPWLLWLLALSALLYVAGIARLWRHAGRSRGIGRAQVAAFAGGWLTLVMALVTPVDTLGAQLFAAHMVQHELLMVAAAPLLVLGRPLAAWTWALAPRHRQLAGRATRAAWLAASWHGLTRPLTAWALHAIALWAWHLPALFEAALHHEGVHMLQHASFLVTALFFWWTVLGGDARAVRGGSSIASLFTTMMHTGALGALLTFAPGAWYPSYGATSHAFGLTPLEDQQLGGLVMWVPGGLAYLAAGLALVGRLLARPALTPATATPPARPR